MKFFSETALRPRTLVNMITVWVISIVCCQTFPAYASAPDAPPSSSMTWVLLPTGDMHGSCTSGTDCCNDIICFGLEYTPANTGDVTTYTTGFFTSCLTGMSPVVSNASCQMNDNSFAIAACMGPDSILFNSSGNDGLLPVTAGVPVILHQVCFHLLPGQSILITEDQVTDLSVSIDLSGGGFADEFPSFTPVTVSHPQPTWPADVTVTVPCISAITVPVAPDGYDYCGNLLTPSLTSVTETPDPLTCEGTRIYSFTYTDCAMRTHVWTYTYLIDQTTGPVEIGGPVPTGEVIDCGLNALPPSMLPVVQDQCGNIIPAPTPIQGGSYTGGCSGTITYTYNYIACSGLVFTWVYTYTVACDPLTLRVFLEGPYNPSGDSLLPDLNVNHVLPGQDKMLSPNLAVQLSAPYTPFGQPYNTPPWNYNGNTGMNFGDPSAPGAPMGVVPYPADVVDWVLVTIRKNGMLPADNFWTCAGWVHTDGEVSFPEACGTLNFLPADDYYILIQHRNHLGILSPTPADASCGGMKLEWDFTTADSYKPLFRSGQKQVEPGIWAMFTANGDQITNIAGIDSPDRTKWRILQNYIGYSLGDYNMNVSTTSQDETIWKLNQNTTSGVIFY